MAEAEHLGDVVAQDQSRIEADDNDSTLGEEDFIGSTKSLESSVEQYVWENNRRYHGFRQGKYAFPNDEDENNREDMKHHATRVLLSGRLQSTMFEQSPDKVLDIGTGTGIWAIEFADDNPASHVVGVDLSPIQPDFVPPNVDFQVDDIEDVWTFQPRTFDFIHIRYMASAIKDWAKLLQQARVAMRPGGKIELVEMSLYYKSDDGTVIEGNRLLAFLDTLVKAGPKLGIDLDAGNRFEDLLRQADFVNARSNFYKLPMGPWARDRRLKEAGFFHREQFLQGIGGIAMGLFGRGMKWSQDEIEVMLAGVRQDIDDRKIHGYWTVQFTTAEVPMKL